MRSTLTETALALFSEGGLDAVSMRGLSARLGISAMTPYHYFADKAEFLSALWQHVLKDLYAAVSRAIERQTERGPGLGRTSTLSFTLRDAPRRVPPRLLDAARGPQVRKDGREQAAIFAAMTDVFRRTMSELAVELGADLTHLKIAEDLVFIALLGYLQAALLNRRYPWSERSELRSACISQIVLTAERCLVDGADDLGAARNLRSRM